MSAFTTIASAFRGGLKPKSARAYIIPLDPYNEDNPLREDEQRSFQYFPETIQDAKGSNYQTKVIPGLSHPLYQWTSSGAREISFQAVFTRDRSLNAREKAAVEGSSLAGRRQDPSSDFRNYDSVRLRNQAEDQGSIGLANLESVSGFSDVRNVDIPSAIAWLRSFMYPEYTIDGQGGKYVDPDRPLPPRKLILGMPGVRINWGEPALNPSEVYCIMLGCPVTYTSFFSDGTPRIARVDLTFAEIIQRGGRIHTQDAFTRRNLGFAGYRINDKGLP